MHDAAQRQPPLTRALLLVALAVTMVLGCLLGDTSSTTAARPNAQAAAEFHARARGRASDFAVVYERPARLATGETVWAAKLVDRHSGAVSLVYRDRPVWGRSRAGPRGARRGGEADRRGAQGRRILQSAVHDRLSRMAITG